MLRAVYASYSISGVKNVEILYSWFYLSLSCELIIDLRELEEFLGSHGRMKYLRPIYRYGVMTRMNRALALIDSNIARDIFAKNRSIYHPIAVKMTEKDLRGD